MLASSSYILGDLTTMERIREYMMEAGIKTLFGDNKNGKKILEGISTE